MTMPSNWRVDSGRLSTKWQSQRPDAAFRIRASICQERGGSNMQKSQAIYCVAIAIAAGLIATRTAEAADNFRKLSDSEIRSKLAGMEITDDVHWTEQ